MFVQSEASDEQSFNCAVHWLCGHNLVHDGMVLTSVD